MVTNNSLIIMPILNLFLSTRKRGMVGKFKDLFKEEKVEMFYVFLSSLTTVFSAILGVFFALADNIMFRSYAKSFIPRFIL